MIRITRETDYALVVLAEMDQRGSSRSHSAREIARWAGLSVPMASKILKALARGELLNSNRGAKGGYALARALERISIGDVIRAMEGPIGLVECVANPGACDQESNCPTRVNWQRINQVLEGALARVPVSEMVERAAPRLLRVGDPGAGQGSLT